MNLHFQAEQAELGYDLLQKYTRTALSQIGILVVLVQSLDPQSEQSQQVEAAARGIRGEIAQKPDQLQAAYLEVKTWSQLALTGDSSGVTADWSRRATDNTLAIGEALAKVTAVLVDMRKRAIEAAHAAFGEKEPHIMKRLLVVADEVDEQLKGGDQRIKGLNGSDSARSSAKNKASTTTAALDTLNNATTGVGMGVVGALDAGGVLALSGGVASVLGNIGAFLGIAFGAIGLVLGMKNMRQGRNRKAALGDARPLLSNEEMDEIAEYASSQKGTKMWRSGATAVGGLAAIGAGALGLAALTITSLGVAAIVAGIAAGLIGLGFVGYKLIHRWRKRKQERYEFADELITQVQTDGAEAEAARKIISDVGLDSENANEPGFRKRLAGKIGTYVKSKRTKMAEGLVYALVAGKPSEVFDAELILQALGMKPEKIRAKVDAGEVNQQVNKVAGKLASW